MSPHRSDHNVLVIASDPMLAALVGMLVEDAKLRAAFPANGERADDALNRVKPLAAVLVDAVLDEAASDVFLMRARKRRIPVLLFGARDATGRVGEWARERQIPSFVLPTDVEALHHALERLPAGDRGTAQRAERTARTEHSDGQLTFFDHAGRRWWVYDRRAKHRRDTVHRSFVSESGETRGCDLAPGEEAANSAEALEEQLSHSTDEPPPQR